jgi:hypothetical protein
MQAVKKDKKTGLPEKYLAGSENRAARAETIKEGQEAYKEGKRLPDSYFDERQKYNVGGALLGDAVRQGVGQGIGQGIGLGAVGLAQYGLEELYKKRKRQGYEHGGILGHDGDPEKEDIQWMEKGGEVKKGKGAKEGKKSLNASTIASLKKKAKESGKSLDTLKKVYRRGQGAYLSSGSRPKTSMAAWAMGRVNSFIKGSKKHDTDLR